MKKSSPFTIFQNSQYTWLFASNISFFFAMQAQFALRAWLAFKMTDSEFSLGLMIFAIAVPMFFLSPFGGVMADRVNRRNLIMAGQFVAFAMDLVILTLLFTDNLEYWHLLSSSAVLGCAFPFIMPARNAIVVNVAGKSRLEHAMAINMGGVNIARFLGPAIAAFLIDFTGPSHAYLMGVSLFGVGLLLMTRVNSSVSSSGGNALSPVKSVMEGAMYMKKNRLVLMLLLFGLIPMFLAMPFQNLLVVFAEKVWQAGPRGFGYLSAAFGLGGVIGSFWVAMIRNTYKRIRRMMVSCLAFGVFLFFFSISPYFWLGLVLVFVANAGLNVFNTLNNTAIQLLIPDQVRGRISSFLMMSFSLPLLGTLPVSAVAEAYGAPFAVALASVLVILICLLFYIFSRDLRHMDESVKNARELV